MNRLKGLAMTAAAALIGASGSGISDEFIEMHTGGEALPFRHMGPFVTRGDGAILAVDSRTALISKDEGKSWESHSLFKDADTFHARGERTLVRTRNGTVVLVFLNEKEKHYIKTGDPEKHYLPTYVTRSLDDGETWEEPRKLQGGWCGAVRQLIQLDSGRLVLPCQNSLFGPWRHVSFSFVSDDDGKTWQKSNVIELEGAGSHAGAMEPTAIELKDGRLYMLIRTSAPWEERQWFWEAFSADGGLTWTGVRNSGILASTCCGTLSQLSDGRISLLWNRPEETGLYNRNTRAELAMAFSTDGCRTWTKPVVVSRRPLQPEEKYYMARQSYPYLYERRPGELWVTTMQGKLRMKLPLGAVVSPPDPDRTVRPTTVVCLGSSTTARRGSVKQVYEQRLAKMLPNMRIVNSGVGGDTTEKARKRFEADMLGYRPDIAIIQLGGNDAAIDVWRGVKTPRTTPERYEENLRYFIGTLKQQGSKVVLMTAGMFRWTPKLKELYGKPPYNPDDPDGFNLKLRPYADIVRRIAQQENVPLVDLFRTHEDYDKVDGQSVDDLFLDGMHPNDTGHAIVADMLLPVVRELAGEE
ncbi:MAG: hypothetical protein HN742_26580 [Lentisphaerae bacterium]|mgnify:CR=1 FL=1|nr:hypothetical protein [Lentisphaerota bacterium]MBT4820235.1 hypothetical protein [Lentisphaerota bacterium]MBT5606030.1 hypothetical protein [Lentisphaerota bacterium]MBT7058581.1 hypothetical protein [Lentisphaerota bacterium]MBT7845469.1 hypothetical protein [Lentisphaerota bacterium]